MVREVTVDYRPLNSLTLFALCNIADSPVLNKVVSIFWCLIVGIYEMLCCDLLRLLPCKDKNEYVRVCDGAENKRV